MCIERANKGTLVLTDAGALPEGHERTEDAVEMLRAMLDGETPLHLKSAFIIHDPAEPEPHLSSQQTPTLRCFILLYAEFSVWIIILLFLV